MSIRPPVCVWLKRDLRKTDHPALALAMARAQGGAVFATFLFEPEIYTQPEWSPRHTDFQHECLVAVVESLARLGIRLITRHGEAVAMLEELRREAGFQLLVAHEETGTGVGYARDRRVRKWARDAGVEFVEVPQTGVVRRLQSRDGWNRIWEARMESPAAILRLEDEPAIEFHNMIRGVDGLREQEISATRLTAWRTGHTGYPLIDACMRSLIATGWLPFRMRALIVSFASYSLWLR